MDVRVGSWKGSASRTFKVNLFSNRVSTHEIGCSGNKRMPEVGDGVCMASIANKPAKMYGKDSPYWIKSK